MALVFAATALRGTPYPADLQLFEAKDRKVLWYAQASDKALYILVQGEDYPQLLELFVPDAQKMIEQLSGLEAQAQQDGGHIRLRSADESDEAPGEFYLGYTEGPRKDAQD